MLNLNLSSSSSSNYIRFMPSINAWINRDKAEIKMVEPFVFDINNIKTGWLHLDTGVRDWQEDAVVGQKGPQPSANHLRGFVATFYNRELGTVEWCSNSTGPSKGFELLYQACAEQQAANAGKLPVIKYISSEAKKIGQGTTRIPKFEITRWVIQPEGMYKAEEVAAMPAPIPVQAAPVPVVTPVQPKSVMAAAVADDEMF